MNITKEQIKQWLNEKSPETISFHSTNMNLGSQGHLISLMEQCLNDLAPKWISVDSSKPKQGIRVLLKTEFDENCPFVVGYWGCGEWEACTVNVEADADYNGNIACVERAFVSNDVTHWMPLTGPTK